MMIPEGFVEVSCDTSVALTRSKEVGVLSIERHGEWGDPDRYEVQTWGFEGQRNGGHWVALITSTASEDGTHKCKHLVPGKGITARFGEESIDKDTAPTVLRLCPECLAGKHAACDGDAWDDDTDDVTACECRDKEHSKKQTPNHPEGSND